MITGRDMDAWIAENILGMVPCDKWEIQRETEFGPVHTKSMGACEHEKCYPIGYPALYTKNMSAAMQVFQEVSEDCSSIEFFEGMYRVSFVIQVGEHAVDVKTFWATCETLKMLPDAICRAAYMAKEGVTK